MRHTKIATAIAATIGLTSAAHAGAFLSGSDLVVVRLGDGASGSPNVNDALNPVAAKVFLDEYDVSGASPVYKNTVALASAGGAALVATSANTYRDGTLNRSADGKVLLYAGYRADAGAGDPVLTTAANVVGVVGANGVANTTASFAGTSGLAVRSAASTNGGDVYFTKDGANSVQYFNASNPAGTLATVTSKAYRTVFTSATQLYGSTGTTATGKGVHAFNPALPTAAATSDPLILAGTLTGADSAVNVVVLDLDASVAGDDTLYGVFSGAVQKFSKTSGGTWVSNGGLPITTGKEFGVAAKPNGTGGVDVFYSTDQAIYKLADGGYNTAFAASLGSAYVTPGLGLGLASASSTAFRGVALAPTVPEPTTLAVLGLAGVAMRRRRASR